MNLTWLRSAIPDAVRSLDVECGWHTVLQVPRVHSDEEWGLELLGKQNVLLQPRFFCDFESKAYLVVRLLTEPALFREGMGRVVSVMK